MNAVPAPVVQRTPGTGSERLRRTVTLGPVRLAFTMAATDPVLRPSTWFDPPGLAGDVEIEVVPGTRPVAAVGLQACDSKGFSAVTEFGAIEVDWPARRGRLIVPAAADLRPYRLRALLQGLMVACQAAAIARGGVVLHGAALATDAGGFVACGPSGAGKSTLAARFPESALHDDQVFAVPNPNSEGAWEVWRQAEYRGSRGDLPWVVPLRGLFVLAGDRARTAVWPLPPQERVPAVVANLYHVDGPVGAKLIDNAVALCRDVPPWMLAHDVATPTADLIAVLAGGNSAEGS